MRMSNRWMRSSFVYLLIIIAILAIFFTFFSRPGAGAEVSISEVVAMAKSGRVQTILVDGDSLSVKTKDGQAFTSRKEAGSSVLETLGDSGVESGVDVQVRGSSG